MSALLYLTPTRLRLYRQRWGVLLSRIDFGAEQMAELGHYLRQQKIGRLSLLLNLYEEEFYPASLPVAHGSERRELFQRTLNKRFPATPYRNLFYQQRQANGRRDQQVLLAGLTEPDRLQRLLEILAEANVAVERIQSLPLLLERGLARWKVAAQPLLLLSRHGALLRLTFFVGGRLKFSRLIPLPEPNRVELIETELAVSRRFLRSRELLAEGTEPLLCSLGLSEVQSPTGCQPLESRVEMATDGSESSLVRLALQPSTQGYDYPADFAAGWRRSLQWLLALLLPVVVIALVWLGAEARIYQMLQPELGRRTAQLEQRLSIAREELSLAEVSRRAELTEAALALQAESADSVVPLWQALATALDAAPEIELERLAWERSLSSQHGSQLQVTLQARLLGGQLSLAEMERSYRRFVAALLIDERVALQRAEPPEGLDPTAELTGRLATQRRFEAEKRFALTLRGMWGDADLAQ